LVSLPLTACVQPPRPTDAAASVWSGRLALQVQDSAPDAVAQSFSAGFELQGSPAQGELRLFTPLGNTLAVLHWSPGHALLVQGEQRRESASVDALTRELTGSDLPIAALFGWLRAEAVQATGWQVDLGALDQARIAATRHAPAPQASLRIVLNR
jgi:outer membrane lipoprotein LolB